MTPLIFILIALGWLGVFWTWARDRRAHGRPRREVGFAPTSASRVDGALAPPRSARMARRRRREVLVALALAALCTLLLARAWSALWVLHLLIDGVLVTYLWAVLSLERPGSVPRRPSITPVLRTDTTNRGRPGPRRQPDPVLP